MDFHSECEKIAQDLSRSVTIPRIKRALEMHSSFYIKCKREERPWVAVYDLEHIRHLEPALIRIMLFVTNLGFTNAQTASWLNLSESSVEAMCHEAWRELRKQFEQNQRDITKVFRPAYFSARIAA
jgi:hypothetical protein